MPECYRASDRRGKCAPAPGGEFRRGEIHRRRVLSARGALDPPAGGGGQQPAGPFRCGDGRVSIFPIRSGACGATVCAPTFRRSALPPKGEMSAPAAVTSSAARTPGCPAPRRRPAVVTGRQGRYIPGGKRDALGACWTPDALDARAGLAGKQDRESRVGEASRPGINRRPSAGATAAPNRRGAALFGAHAGLRDPPGGATPTPGSPRPSQQTGIEHVRITAQRP